MDQLETLVLIDSALNGTIPSEIARLSRLTSLSLSSSNLSGQVPTELGRLTGLTLLDLGYNQLTGTLPSELALLTNLDTSLNATLESNNIGGRIPPQICQAIMEWGLRISGDCEDVKCDCGCLCAVVSVYDDE